VVGIETRVTGVTELAGATGWSKAQVSKVLRGLERGSDELRRALRELGAPVPETDGKGTR